MNRSVVTMTMMNASLGLAVLLGALMMTGCEDPVPTDYVPQYVFTGYLIVDRPVSDVTLSRSLAPLDTFVFAEAAVADASIRIWSDQDTIDLVYRASDSGVGGYFGSDDAQLVRPGTTYHMEAQLQDGTVLRSETTTPQRIEWIQAPRDTLQYPKDTLKLPSPDSLKLIWTRAEGVTEYLIRVQSLDTLGYGVYLTPPTNEPNRRIERFFEENAPRYNDVVRWGFLQNTQTNVVWVAFKWFGLHDVTVYAPDPAMLEWFKQLQFGGNQYNDLLSNVEGGIGVFGSASIVTSEPFVLKNQP